MRSITCWALSRYAHWIVQAAAEGAPAGQQRLNVVIAVRAC